MGINTVPPPPYSPDLTPCDFCLFPKLRGCHHYETIEEMKEAVMKVIDMLTREDFHGAFQKLLEQYNKCIAAGGDYFEGDESFLCVLSIKVPIQRKSGNLLYAPCIFYLLVWNKDGLIVYCSERNHACRSSKHAWMCLACKMRSGREKRAIEKIELISS